MLNKLSCVNININTSNNIFTNILLNLEDNTNLKVNQTNVTQYTLIQYL